MIRVLIVDDSKTELDVMLFLIQKNSLPIISHTASDGEDALEMLKQNTYDILITDIRMPYVDGLTLSKEALQLQPGLKIILSSGYQDFSYAKTAISLGVEEYLLKPVNPEEFSELLVKLIHRIDEERAEKKTNHMQIRYSRDQISQQLLTGTLHPDKSGFLPEQIRSIMPSSLLLIALSTSHSFLENLMGMEKEILEVGNHYFNHPLRCVRVERIFYLMLDSPESCDTITPPSPLRRTPAISGKYFMTCTAFPSI